MHNNLLIVLLLLAFTAPNAKASDSNLLFDSQEDFKDEYIKFMMMNENDFMNEYKKFMDDYHKNYSNYKKSCDEKDRRACQKFWWLIKFQERELENRRERNFTKMKANGFQKDCDKGDMKACFSLGSLYSKGAYINKVIDDGIPRYHKRVIINPDYKKAYTYYKKACDKDYREACSNLGLLYSSGLGTDKDYKKAVKIFQKSCDLGSMTGCNNLAAMYGNGDGVKKDYVKTRNLMKKVCESGDVSGCYGLGDLYSISILIL